MAQRPLFIPVPDGLTLVSRVLLDFAWSPGLSLARQRRCIAALHAAGQAVPGVNRILDPACWRRKSDAYRPGGLEPRGDPRAA